MGIHSRHFMPRAMVLVAVATAGFVLGRMATRNGGVQLPETLLHADAAANDDEFAVAVGPIDENSEGLFVMDFLTGQLQCTIMGYRTGKFNAVFAANVANDLGLDPSKKPKYLLITGGINFPRGGAVSRPANSVCYVVDTNTGKFAAYGISWRREWAAAGRPQGGNLYLMDIGKARTAELRE